MPCALLQSFVASLAAFPMASDDKILVAVSGGPDSVCLLHLLRQWICKIHDQGSSPPHGDRLHVAHLNHGLRPEADEDAEFVARLCRSWGIPSTIEKRSVAAFCKEKRLSKQEGARLVRYAFLREVADVQKVRWIALGHTADDCAETVLMNLIRGAGGEGLDGIPRMREETIIRPMVHLSRDAILRELAAHQIPYREDATNQDRRFLRSRIRHDLVPMLRTFNPNIQKTLLRAATLLEEDNCFWAEQVERLAPQVARATSDAIVYDLPRLGLLHKALQRRLLRWGIRHLQGNVNGIGFGHIELILKAVGQDRETQIFLPHRLWAQKKGDTLYLARTCAPLPAIPDSFEISRDRLQQCFLGTPVTLEIPSWKMRLRFEVQARAEIAYPKETDVAFFDCDTIRFPLWIRSWEPGDRMAPIGMRGRHKKLQDFFVDRKIPQDVRRRIPLLVGPEGILWITGYIIDHRYRVTEKTQRMLVVRVVCDV